MATTEYRYVQRKHKSESQLNLHVKEMIEMIKNEEVKDNLYVKGIKLSSHALERMEEHFGISNVATATKMIKDMLSKAKRIGSVLAYDGRINVLYAYDKTAIFLSPNLKTVVTINRYADVTYKPIMKDVDKDSIDKQSLIELHFKHLSEIERQEEQQIKRMLEIDSLVNEANQQYQLILDVGSRGKGRRKQVKGLISDQNLMLKQEGRKLFNIKVEKRHICKSLVSLM
jgi:hypothetical protein